MELWAVELRAMELRAMELRAMELRAAGCRPYGEAGAAARGCVAARFPPLVLWTISPKGAILTTAAS